MSTAAVEIRRNARALGDRRRGDDRVPRRRPPGPRRGDLRSSFWTTWFSGRRANLRRGSGLPGRCAWSRATSRRRMRGRTHRGTDLVFHLAALRIPSVPRKGEAGQRGPGRRGTFNVLEAAPGSRRWRRSSPSSASVYRAGAKQFPTTERHHPGNGPSTPFYGAAKAFNEGIACRSFPRHVPASTTCAAVASTSTDFEWSVHGVHTDEYSFGGWSASRRAPRRFWVLDGLVRPWTSSTCATSPAPTSSPPRADVTRTTCSTSPKVTETKACLDMATELTR